MPKKCTSEKKSPKTFYFSDLFILQQEVKRAQYNLEGGTKYSLSEYIQIVCGYYSNK